MRDQVHRPFEAQPVDEAVQRFPDKRTEDSMEVIRREAADLRDILELQGLVEVARDMIYRPVDPVDVVELRKIRQVTANIAGYDRAMATLDALPLGNFSVSLAVKDLAASRAFYEKLGFVVFGGDAAQNWLIMQNGAATIGLFQGMFERNMLTFNPGWDAAGNTLPQFTDVRELQRRVKQAGIVPSLETDESGQGPASFMVIDPDGNPILVDQHV